MAAPEPTPQKFLKPSADLEAGKVDEVTQLSNFRFKSFRTHKLIEEDYGLITVDEPEELPMIKTTNLIHEN